MVWVALIIGIILLFVFPKQVGGLIVVAILGLGAFYLYLQADENARKKQQDSVTVSVLYNLKACSKDYPLHVSIKNDSSKIVDKVSWNIGALKPGYSNNIVDYGYSIEYSTPFSSDKILNPNQQHGLCYKVPKLKDSSDPSTLNWLIVRKSIEFNRD
jgi:hypothetical protein